VVALGGGRTEALTRMTDRVDTPRETVLKAHGIRKVFRTASTELEVLKGVSLEVQRGEMIAITGARSKTLYIPAGAKGTSGACQHNQPDTGICSHSWNRQAGRHRRCARQGDHRPEFHRGRGR